MSHFFCKWTTCYDLKLDILFPNHCKVATLHGSGKVLHGSHCRYIIREKEGMGGGM